MKFLSTTFYLLLLSFISFAQTFESHERIYLGTGEYSPHSTWDAILRLDTTENFNGALDSSKYFPDGTVPMKQCIVGDSAKLNFGHGLYYQQSKDRMFVATIFTNSGNYYTSNSDTAVGAIGIFDNFSTANGGTIPTRYIFGDSTKLLQPHGCWVDEKRDILYVANTFGENILVFENASTINGNVAPNRVISHDSLGLPVYIYVDSMVDRMFVCAMPAMGKMIPSIKSQIAIYSDSASYLDGSIEPDIRITGPNTRLELINQTVHNCWFNPSKQLLAVGHHIFEMLFFNLSSIDWSTPIPIKYDLTPRVIRVDDPTAGHDSSDVNLYGFFWDLETDRMFCSIGIDNPGGGPMSSCPPSGIKIYSNVSDSTLSGVVAPDRIIYWSNCSTYYPPQPIWVQKYTSLVTSSDSEDIKWDAENPKIYFSPTDKKLVIEMNPSSYLFELKITDVLGRNLLAKSIQVERGIYTKMDFDIGYLKESILFVSYKSENTIITKKIYKR